MIIAKAPVFGGFGVFCDKFSRTTPKKLAFFTKNLSFFVFNLIHCYILFSFNLIFNIFCRKVLTKYSNDVKIGCIMR